MKIGQEEARRRGWPWLEPISVREGLRHYRIWTNANARSGNVEIVVRTDTGEVERVWMGVR
jgi:hypothetical protein